MGTAGELESGSGQRHKSGASQPLRTGVLSCSLTVLTSFRGRAAVEPGSCGMCFRSKATKEGGRGPVDLLGASLPHPGVRRAVQPHRATCHAIGTTGPYQTPTDQSVEPVLGAFAKPSDGLVRQPLPTMSASRQAVATHSNGFASLSRFNRRLICDRLRTDATAMLHKRSIPS